MLYTITLNPALDKTVEIPSLTVDSVNRITTMRTDPGGKGINVSKVIDKLGGKSIASGILGGQTGQSILAALDKMNLESRFLFVDGETRTNLKIIDPVLHTNTDINEPGVTVSKEILDKLLEQLLSMISADDIVILAGSLPKGSPGDTYGVWIKAIREAGAKVFLDADGELLAEGFGVKAMTIAKREDIRPVLQAAIDCKEPVLINCIIDKDINVLPMVPGGKSVEEPILEM